MQELLTVAAIVFLLCLAFVIAILKLLEVNRELSKLLASRNYTEYSVGEARMAKADAEQKPKSYEDAWSEDQ